MTTHKTLTGYGNIVLNDREYRELTAMIHAQAGIALGNNKRQLVHARLSKILRTRNIGKIGEYLDMLRSDRTGDELVMLLDAISTNVTEFFREPQHFDFLVDMVREYGLAQNLRIWSAGCSSGEEPYSIAITLLEYILSGSPRPDPYVLATDLSTKVLDRAATGVFPMKSVERLDRKIVKKYFLRGTNSAENYVKVKPNVARMITFRRLNFAGEFRFRVGFDVIFCRNVMIYFDRATRERLVHQLHQALNPGGFLLIGHSESLNGISHALRYIRPTIYRKL